MLSLKFLQEHLFRICGKGKYEKRNVNIVVRNFTKKDIHTVIELKGILMILNYNSKTNN